MGETPGWVQPTSPPQWGPPSSAGWGPPPPPPGWSPLPPPPGWGPPPPMQQPRQWGGWQPRPADVKPGIVALRPLSVGEILDGGFATIRRYPRIAFGFAAAFAAVLELARLVTGLAMRNLTGSLTSFYSTSRRTPDELPQYHLNGAGLASTVVEYVLGGVFGALLAGIVTVIVGKAILGQHLTGRDVAKAVRPRAWRLLLVGLLAGLGPFAPALLIAILAVLASVVGDVAIVVVLVIGIPLALAAGIVLWGKLALAVPAFMLERLDVGASIMRSWRLVRGAFWRVWGLRALVSLIVGIAGSVISLLFVVGSGFFGGFSFFTDGGQRPLGALIVVAIGDAVVWMLTQPLVAAALTLIYVDRRMRAEGLDIQLVRAAQAAPTTGRS